MAYPTTDWPGAVDAGITRADLVDTVFDDDFNYPDDQITTIQLWLGSTHGELIGDDGTVTHGPGGMVSPIADGGTAIKLAARDAYTSGKLLSVGDDEDLGYVEKFAIEATGLLSVVGVTNYETLVIDDDDIPNKKYTDDAIDAAILAEDFWDRTGTVIHPNTAGDTLTIGDGVVAAPGYSFTSEVGLGWWRSAAGTMALAKGGATLFSVDDSRLWSATSQSFRMSIGAGVVGTPTYSFQDFGDSGIYLESTTPDVIGFSLDGVKAASLGDGLFTLTVDPVTIAAPVVKLLRSDDHGDAVDVGDSQYWGIDNADGTTPVKFAGIRGHAIEASSATGAQGKIVFGLADGTITVPTFTDLFEMRANAVGVLGGGQLICPTGIVSLPSIAIGAIDTGIFRETATPDVLAFVADGAKVLSISDAQMLIQDGSTLLPGIALLSDPSTGIRGAGASIWVGISGVLRTNINVSNIAGNANLGYSMRHAAGTVLLPTYNFKGFVDTGVFLKSTGADVVGFTSDGVETATLAAAGFDITGVGAVYSVGGTPGISGTFNFDAPGSGDTASMTFVGGILTATTQTP